MSGNATFAPMVYANVESDAIGSVKAGFVCLPSGSLHWRDLKLPRDGHLAEKALLAFSESVAVDGRQVVPTQFEGYVQEVTMTLCVAGLGIGEKKPKGKGKINIMWTQTALDTNETLKSTAISSEFDIKGIDPRRDSLALEQALLANFKLFLMSDDSK
jgi:hypothetical protein